MIVPPSTGGWGGVRSTHSFCHCEKVAQRTTTSKRSVRKQSRKTHSQNCRLTGENTSAHIYTRDCFIAFVSSQ
jgi:hypothetical protein